MSSVDYDETITLPRALRFPVELLAPRTFDPERLETWPRVTGRLEHVGGRLLYMPPCGDVQADTVTDVVITLGSWVRSHAGFVLGTNEVGMRLGGATRAADAAIWRRAALGQPSGGLRRVPPLLAVEVAGDDEPESLLVDKAEWYRSVGVPTVWIVVPSVREVVVIDAAGRRRFGRGARLPEPAELAALSPGVDELFVQLDR